MNLDIASEFGGIEKLLLGKSVGFQHVFQPFKKYLRKIGHTIKKIAATLLAVACSFTLFLAPAMASDTCTKDSLKVDTPGDPKEVTFAVPKGFNLISICVKAGQDVQTISVSANPGQTVTFSSPNGKSVSHFRPDLVEVVATPEPIASPVLIDPSTQPPSVRPEPTELPVVTPTVTPGDTPISGVVTHPPTTMENLQPAPVPAEIAELPFTGPRETAIMALVGLLCISLGVGLMRLGKSTVTN